MSSELTAPLHESETVDKTVEKSVEKSVYKNSDSTKETLKKSSLQVARNNVISGLQERLMRGGSGYEF